MKMNRETSNWPKPARVKADGGCIARCPACAEQGQDTKGEHLWWNPVTGAFSCIAHQRDAEHRQAIVSLVGTPTRPTGRMKKTATYRPLRLGEPVWSGFKNAG